DEWKSGPVPPEIGCNASFGIGSAGIGKVGNDPYKYWGDEQLINLLNSNKILFLANERCCGRNSLYFHNGELLIIDVDSQKVWFSSWDY
ncbi:MAG: hypothetical protein JW934_03050, partial [Anaerolineae bacterium]|nr:hypothetical protein [Anaerolineae bacterium]